MTTKTRNLKRGGSVILVCLVAASMAMLMVIVLQGMGTAYWHSQRLITSAQAQQAKDTLRTVFQEDIINALETSGTFPHLDPAASFRRARSVNNAVWATGGTFPSLTYGAIAGGIPFSKGNALSGTNNGNSQHPLNLLASATFTQTFSATFVDAKKYLGALAYTFTAEMREVPVSEVAYIAVDQFDPALNTVGITVTGTALTSKGYSNAAVAAKLTAINVVSPSSGGTGVSATRTYVNPLFRLAWGTPSPANITANFNQMAPANQQSYFDGAQWVVTVQNGQAFNLIPGVTFREFPAGSGTKRVIVTLNALPSDKTKIYINCITPADQLGGIVVIGDGGSPVGANKVVASNGAVWLWGVNLQPCIVASGRGAWTFTDQTWSESLPGNASLAMTWYGLICAPVTNTFSTPQAGAGARLTVVGTLVTGNISGTLPAISVTENQGTSIRSLCERVLFLYRFTSP